MEVSGVCSGVGGAKEGRKSAPGRAAGSGAGRRQGLYKHPPHLWHLDTGTQGTGSGASDPLRRVHCARSRGRAGARRRGGPRAPLLPTSLTLVASPALTMTPAITHSSSVASDLSASSQGAEEDSRYVLPSLAVLASEWGRRQAAIAQSCGLSVQQHSHACSLPLAERSQQGVDLPTTTANATRLVRSPNGGARQTRGGRLQTGRRVCGTSARVCGTSPVAAALTRLPLPAAAAPPAAGRPPRRQGPRRLHERRRMWPDALALSAHTC